MKICSTCKETKPLTEFSKNRSAKDGLQSQCRICHRASVKASIEKHRDRFNAYQRKWQKNPKRVAYWKAYVKDYEHSKIEAQYTANNAEKRGELTPKPCVICGALDAEKHHQDYSKPYDVIWLCHTHHKQLHHKRFSLLPITQVLSLP